VSDGFLLEQGGEVKLTEKEQRELDKLLQKRSLSQFDIRRLKVLFSINKGEK